MQPQVVIKTYLMYKNTSYIKLSEFESNPFESVYDVTDDEKLYYNFVTLGYENDGLECVQIVVCIRCNYKTLIGFEYCEDISFWGLIIILFKIGHN